MALPKRFLIGVLFAIASGCASTQSLVESRFAALHGCPAETVRATAGGWVATGCGVQAHFVCFDTDDDDDDYDSDEETFASHMIGRMLFSGLDDDDVCIQEQVERGPERVRLRDPTVVSKGKDGTVRLRAHVPLLDAPRGALTLVGIPAWRDPSVAIRMALQLEAALPEQCGARLWIDGVPDVVRAERKGDATVTMALTAEQLARLAYAQHAGLEACGTVAMLDAGAMARLRLFSGRFAEARARLLPAAMAKADADAGATP